MGGGLKAAEMEIYEDVLRGLGHSTEREQERVRQSDGSIYLKGTYIGAVDTAAEADAIKAELEKRLSYLPWHVVQIP